jgi:RNA polymerase sigma-70 factor (ECF subfamily)
MDEGAMNDPDHRLFMRLFLEEQGVLLAYLLASTRNQAKAEEILQEVAGVLWETFAKYDQSRPFRAWALGVARLQVLKARQEIARSREVLGDEALTLLADTAARCAEEVDERGVHLKDCLANLSQPVRDLVQLRFLDGLPIAAIADRLGRTVAAIEMGLVRVRRMLRACVERRMQREGGQA